MKQGGFWPDWSDFISEGPGLVGLSRTFWESWHDWSNFLSEPVGLVKSTSKMMSLFFFFKTWDQSDFLQEPEGFAERFAGS